MRSVTYVKKKESFLRYIRQLKCNLKKNCVFILKSLEIDLLLLESGEFPIFAFQNRKDVRSYGRVKVYIECRRIEGVSFIFDSKGFFFFYDGNCKVNIKF